MAQESRLVITVDSKNAKHDAETLAKVMAELEKAGVRVTTSSSKAGKTAADAGKKMAGAGKDAQSGASGVDKFRKSIDGAQSAAISLRGAMTGAFVGISVAGLFQKIMSETRNLEQEQAQLAAVLKSTGNAAGFGRDQLNDMAEAMSAASLLTGGEITQAQTTLLAFTGIVGDQFTEALQAAIDMSARTGMSVVSAAETIGRALDVPSQGLTALSRQGFRFSDEQKKLAEQLEATGKTAEAQGIVLTALKDSYGGAAAAARDTFGGSLTGLRNTISDLMSGKDGSLDGAKFAVQQLTSTLQSEDTKRAFETFVSFVTGATNSFANFTATIGAGSIWGWLITSGDDARNAEAKIAELEKRLEGIQERRRGIAESWVPSLSYFDSKTLDVQEASINAQLDTLRVIAAQNRRAAELDYVQNNFVGPMRPTTLDQIDVTPTGEPAPAKKQIDAGQQYIDQMSQRISLLGKETELEKLLANISSGSLDFRSEKQKEMAKQLAIQFDTTQKQTEMERILGDLRLQQSTSQIQFMRELEAFGEGDRVRELNAELAKVEDRYRSLIESRRNSAQGLSDSDLTQIRASLEKELSMVREHHEKKRAIQQDWRLGARDALTNYADDAMNVYSSVGNAAQSMFKGMEDALTGFVRTGKLSFSDFANSIIEDMIRITVQQSITGPLAGMFGGWLGGLGSSSGAVSGASLPGIGGTAGGLLDGIKFSSGGYTGDGGRFEPAGIVHKGEGVLNQDEIRAMGGAAGFNSFRRALRGPGHASGGMAGYPALPPMAVSPRAAGAVSVTVNVSGDGGGSQVSAPAGWEDFAKEIGEFVDARIRAREARSQRQGGLAWQAKQGAFG